MDKTKIDGGATLWARQTIDSDIFYHKPDKWFKIWFYLVNKANHKDNKQFRRGTCFLKYDWIMDKTRATKDEVAHCVKWLKSATMIATTKATGGFIVEVLKYNAFQSLESYKNITKATAKATATATQKQHKSYTINKNDKNDKNVRKREYIPAVFLNEEEHQKLVKEIGEDLTQEYMQDLSLYIQSKGKRYKSHYATILSWYRKDIKEGKRVHPKDDENVPQYEVQKMNKEELLKRRQKGIEELKKINLKGVK